MKQATKRRCPACRKADLQPGTWVREFHPRKKPVRVELLTSVCASCGAQATSAAQHSENLKRLKARKAHYGGLLLGEEIFALRRRYGITQQAAGRIFGKGKIAFSRYENETSYPDETTTRLLELAIEKPDVIRWLADKAGEELPFWSARCEEERSAKVRILTGVQKVRPETNRWTKGVERQSRLPPRPAGPLLHWLSDTVESIETANDDRFPIQEAVWG